MIYTVGEMAKKLNLTTSTLRYYDKEGLIPFVERSSGGMRMFKDEDMGGLMMIECLKKTGMSIKDIKHFMDCCKDGDSAIDERLAIIKAQKDLVIEKMNEMQDMLNMLKYKCWYYETAKEAGTCEIHSKIDKKMVPEEFHKYLWPIA